MVTRYRKPIIIAALMLIPAIYVASYIVLGQRVCGYREQQTGAMYCGFSYTSSWKARFFIPVAAMESLIFQRNVAVGTIDELTWTSPVRDTSQIQPSSID
jgi:threonine/homoserine efflux transporter RhtA